MTAQVQAGGRPLIDGFGRRITYLRISVTDRCDLRCRYCMAEAMTFMPREQILSLEEIAAVADAFIARGVRKIRLTGGEPLIRRGIPDLARLIGRHIGTGDLDELTLTTNGTNLARSADALFDAGVRRVNVSLDSRDPAVFRHITRWGDVDKVLDGIRAAKAAGLRVKINMVALKGLNEAEIEPMLRWCAGEGHDLTLIETMPLGMIDEDRTDRYLPLDGVRDDLASRYTLTPLADRTGGPARYHQVTELGARIGFITPLTENFCAGCNRVRITATGKLYMCLGHDDRVDLRAALREGGPAALDALLDEAMSLKPLRHDFRIEERNAAPAVQRHMSVTGG
ncbi:cyclic pyranopterin monophosphate synthase subunit MoaA [Sphingomonas laterariae]|uniref:GTP 3',8-cyclase n=1 Tax=Edaphosphingomonas laterariae TaxID=861865 RepID=A0A239EE32_9SPHN|nr:GTP 3',8-cyclase MoaA [Sphingomonas laterariae]SNS42789.1 cyclic pyranopterin monophosphate synthase subunit MoaA [Sphingomonas laterariae]